MATGAEEGSSGRRGRWRRSLEFRWRWEQRGQGSQGGMRGPLVPKNFHLEICVFFFGYVYKVLNVVKQ